MAELLDLDIDVKDTISKALEIAPRRITWVIQKRFNAERNRFVGNRKKGKTGSFTRHVLSMPLRNRTGMMPMKVAGLFRGFAQKPTGDSDLQTLRLGILKNNPKPFIRGVMDLQEGYNRTSGRYMPIPVYSNLRRQGFAKGWQRIFQIMSQANKLQPIKLGGKMLWVDKEMMRNGADIDDATMFIGVKRVTVRPYNFNFVGSFLKAWPGFNTRLKNAIDREIGAINRGYVKAE